MSKIFTTVCFVLLLVCVFFLSCNDMAIANDNTLANSKTLPNNLDLSKMPNDRSVDTSVIWAKAEAENWRVNGWNEFYLRCLLREMRSRIMKSSKDFENSDNYIDFDSFTEGLGMEFILLEQDLIITTTLSNGRYTDQLYCSYDLENNKLKDCIQCEVNWMFCNSINSSTRRYVYHCYLQSDGLCVGELIDLQTMKFVTPEEIPCLGDNTSDNSVEDVDDKLLIKSFGQEWHYRFDKKKKLFVLEKEII